MVGLSKTDCAELGGTGWATTAMAVGVVDGGSVTTTDAWAGQTVPRTGRCGVVAARGAVNHTVLAGCGCAVEVGATVFGGGGVGATLGGSGGTVGGQAIGNRGGHGTAVVSTPVGPVDGPKWANMLIRCDFLAFSLNVFCLPDRSGSRQTVAWLLRSVATAPGDSRSRHRGYPDLAARYERQPARLGPLGACVSSCG